MELGDLSVLFDFPKASNWLFRHVTQDRAHKIRWTDPNNPENPQLIFGPTMAKLDLLRALTQDGMKQFSVDVQTTDRGTAKIIGDIDGDGKLWPKSVFWPSMVLDRDIEIVDLTDMIEDPFEARPDVPPYLTKVIQTFQTLREASQRRALPRLR